MLTLQDVLEICKVVSQFDFDASSSFEITVIACFVAVVVLVV